MASILCLRFESKETTVLFPNKVGYYRQVSSTLDPNEQTPCSGSNVLPLIVGTRTYHCPSCQFEPLHRACAGSKRSLIDS